MVLNPFEITPDVMNVAPAVRLAETKFPGFTLGVIMEVEVANIDELKADDVAVVELEVENEVGSEGMTRLCEFRLPPSASAIATGKLVNPGLISAAGVTNFRTVSVKELVRPADPVGAAMTDVETAFGLDGAVHGAVTVTYIDQQGNGVFLTRLTVMTVSG